MVFVLVSYSRWIGIIAGLFTAASLIPPLFKFLKEKKPETVPLGMLVVLLVGLALWIYYGILQEDWPIIITNCFSFLQNVTMIILRHRYRNNKHSYAKK